MPSPPPPSPPPGRRLAARLVPLALLGGTLLAVLAARALYGPGPSGAAEKGAEVFWGRGRCGSCHSLAGEGGSIRCPDLGRTGTPPATLVERAAGRVPGLAPLDYLAQSLYRPEAHVVDGYPAGLMPDPTAAPIALTDAEVEALLAFLAGEAPAAAVVAAAAAARAGRAPAAVPGVARPGRAGPLVAGDAGRGQLVFETMRCDTCHVIEGITAPDLADSSRRRGPDLTGIGAVQGREYLTQAVWEPEAVVIPGPGGLYLGDDGRSTRMPSYRGVMSGQDLADLVAFLASLR